MSLNSPFTTKIERGAYSAIVYKEGTRYIAENNVGTLIQEGTDEATITEAAVTYVEANGGGTVYVKGFWASVKSTGATRVVVEYEELIRIDLPALRGAIRIQRDGYVEPAAGAIFNLGIGTEATPNSEGTFGIFSYMRTDQAPGTGVVRGNYWATLKIDPSADFNGCCYTANIEDRGNTTEEHVGFYAVLKGGVGAGWLFGFADEVWDTLGGSYSNNVVIVGAELCNSKKNPNSTSLGLHIVAKGTQVHDAAIRIGHQETASWAQGIHIEHSTVVGIEISGASSASAIRIPLGNKISLEGSDSIYVKSDSAYTTFIQDVNGDRFEYNKANDRFDFFIANSVIGYVDATGFHNGAPP